jgi:hypothetical protein
MQSTNYFVYNKYILVTSIQFIFQFFNKTIKFFNKYLYGKYLY